MAGRAASARRRGKVLLRATAVAAAALISLSLVTPVARAATSIGDYVDRFSFISYGNSMGSLNWEPDWQESGDDSSPWTGAFQISSDPQCPSVLCLVIGREGADDASLARAADLSAADTATLSMITRRHKQSGNDIGVVRLSASADGMTGWATLQEWRLDSSDPAAVASDFDLTPWISATTTIRFELIAGADDSHINIDDLRIELFAEDNLPPVLDPISSQGIDEEVPFAFTATATDPNTGDLLTFELDGSEPAGATMTTGGDFAWTPTEAQGPGIYVFDVIVRDNGTPQLSDSQTVTLTVTEVNAPPTLDPLPDRSVTEGSLLTFVATASDAETLASDLVFQLYGSPPSGAVMTTAGMFTWIPTEAQGPGTYDIEVKVWDDGAPAAYDHGVFTVTVAEHNLAPQLPLVPDQFVDEGVELSFSAAAADGDLPANALSYGLAGAPPGAAITTEGIFTWTPSDAQGPGIYAFDIVVLDDGTPVLSDTTPVTVTVAEANIAPVITPISPKFVAEGSVLQFVAMASDPDSPANAFEFSLRGAPAGASITPGGLFTWTPTEIQGPGTYRFDVVATDDGLPAMADTEEVTVTVTEVNSVPILTPIPRQSIEEGALFELRLDASDADSPANELTFTAEGAPPGVVVTPAGLLSWTPSEDQGPGTISFDIVVTDDGTPALSDRQTLTFDVSDANNPPVIDPIGTLTGVEGELITFTAAAVDHDVPPNAFWFRLSGDVPAGAGITSSGVFSWIPDELQGPGSYSFDVVVTDTGFPSRSSSAPVTIEVLESNEPPFLETLEEYSAEAGFQFLLAVNAVDPDHPEQALEFAASGLPEGAALSQTGTITWLPSEDEVGTSHRVRLTVSDSGTPPLSSSAEFNLTVVIANAAPILSPIGDKQVEAGQMLTFVAEATDEDGAAEDLRFALSADAPSGAAMDPRTGVFEWRPTLAQDGAVYRFAVKVTDAGVLPKSDSEVIAVAVGRPNVTPRVEPPPDQHSVPGESVTLAVSATDPDAYPSALVYTASNLPAGLTIDGITGRISGKPTFAALNGSPYRVEVVVSDGRDSTAASFDWVVTGVAVPPAATSSRTAVVSGINEVLADPGPSAEVHSAVGRSLVLMARAVRSGVSEMSLPFLLLVVMIVGVASLGRIGIVPLLRRRARHDGVLVRYDPDTGSGLVARLGDGGEVFVHASAIARRDRYALAPGDAVTFRTVDGAYRDLVTKLRSKR